jgi:hypothetical protein
MSAPPAAKRARPPALDAVVSTVAAPGLGKPNGLFVLADGTLLACAKHSIRVLAPSGIVPAGTFAGSNTRSGKEDGPGADARFHNPDGITVDPAGNVVVVDRGNHALRLVSKAGAVSTLAGGGGAGFADGQGAAARFNCPVSVVVTANGDYVMTDFDNHALRVVTPGGAVRTLAGNGEPGLVDGQGAAARFNQPGGLAVDVDQSILVTEKGNHALRRVTMAGLVSTVAGNGQKGYADGEGTAARFNWPSAVVVDKEGTIIVADRVNNCLRRLTGRHVTTLAGGSEAGTADGAGPGARFTKPWRSLAPPPWMGPLKEKNEPPQALGNPVLEDYAKLADDGDLADVVFVVEGQRFPAYRGVLAVRSEYFRGLFKSGMQDGGTREVCYENVSASAFRVLLRFLYTGEVPAWGVDARGEGGGGAGGSGGGGGAGGRRGAGGKGGVNKGAGGNNGGKGGKGKEEDKEEEAAESAVQELLRVADRFQAGGLYEHCLAEFGRGLTVDTAVEQLVWAHAHAPEGARTVAMEYVVANCGPIQVSLPRDKPVCLACMLDAGAGFCAAIAWRCFVGDAGMLCVSYDRGGRCSV